MKPKVKEYKEFNDIFEHVPEIACFDKILSNTCSSEADRLRSSICSLWSYYFCQDISSSGSLKPECDSK